MKYRVKQHLNVFHSTVRYVVEQRFLWIFWSGYGIRSFVNKQDAIDLCNKLNEKIIVK